MGITVRDQGCSLLPTELLRWNGIVADDARPATAITMDSRQVNPQTAFVALPGMSTHGRLFVDEALGRGAPFVVSDQAGPRTVVVEDTQAVLCAWARYKRDVSNTQIIGITGSAGKTTTKEFVFFALDGISGGVCSTKGNLNTLNAIACHLLSYVDQYAFHVIEMGIDHIGDMDKLIGIVRPNIGVVTSIGPAHLQGLGSIDRVALEKGKIFRGCAGFVSIKASPHYKKSDYPDVRTYGFDPTADICGAELVVTDRQVSYRFRGHLVELATPSEHVGEASLVALGIAQHFGVEFEHAIECICRLQSPQGRMHVLRGKFILIDDAYNANPLSVRASLETLARFNTSRVAVLGDMRELGSRAEHYHNEIGDLAGRVAHVVFAVGEHATTLASAAEAAGASVYTCADADEVVQVLQSSLSSVLAPGAAVLVKGSNKLGLSRVVEALRAKL